MFNLLNVHPLIKSTKLYFLSGVFTKYVFYILDKVWPVPSDLVPYDVFSKPFDTITELPKPVQDKAPKSAVDLSESLSGSIENFEEPANA